jgi:hypothetical protein
MRSFIFSFKSLAVAAALIGLIEGVCALTLRPGFVERANVGLLDLFHNTVLFGKLDAFADSAPDVIQVGDSSGFHGVRPEVVMHYLGGLKYVNLSCCADTGYRGYYAIADFMLRRNPGIKAIVLYVSLNDLPRTDLIHGQHRMGDYMQDSLTTPFAQLAPPTLALRQRIADQVKADRLGRNEGVLVADMRENTLRHSGWWAEHDRRLSGQQRIEYWRKFCGDTGIAIRNDDEVYYGEDILRRRRSYMRMELQRFASLAADHGAKFVVAFHPFSCRGLEGNFLDARREDLRILLAQNDNMIALPEEMLALWPTERFVGPAHLHIGYDEENSRRLARLLARALGVRNGDGARATLEAAAPAAEASAARPVRLDWRSDGAAVALDAGAGDTPGDRRISENAGAALHRVHATLAGLTPGATMVLSFPARPIGKRGILLELNGGTQSGGGFCDLPGGTATRERDMLDAGIEPQPDGWSRCWVAMVVDAPSVDVHLTLLDERLDPGYVGDGRSGVVVGPFELRETARFLAQERSPW